MEGCFALLMTLRLRRTANVTLKIDDDKQECDVLLFEVLQMDRDKQGEFRLHCLQWKGYVKFLCKEEYYKAVLSGQPKDTDRAWLVALKDPTLTGKLEKHNKPLFFLVCTAHCSGHFGQGRLQLRGLSLSHLPCACLQAG